MMNKKKLINFMTLGGGTFFHESSIALMDELFEVLTIDQDFRLDDIKNFNPDAILTGWGTGHAKIDQEFIDIFENLKVWGHLGSSLAANYKLDKRPENIKIINTASIIGRYVAETTILNMGRMLRRYDYVQEDFCNNNHHGHYNNSDFEKSLFTAKIGLIGLGCVGREVVKLLSVFSKNIYIYDPFIDEAFAEKYHLKSTNLDYIAENCDAISIHVPSLPETEKLIDAKFLAKMKDNSVLINTARGSIVDSEALAKELKNRRLFAAIDVVNGENDALLQIKNQVNYLYTPHMAGILPAARPIMLEGLLKEIKNILDGADSNLTASSAALRMG